MKKVLILFAVIFFTACASLRAQNYNYGNEWIDYSLEYYKLKIYKEGIYRISYSQLLGAGVSNSVVQSKHKRIQIFHNGVEQYLYIYDNNNNDTLNQNDFIEFYADKNDGWLDRQLYDDTNWQPNKRYSLFNDTAVYFLTWNNYPSVPAGKRVTELNDTSPPFSNHLNAPYFIRESFVQNTHSYNDAEVQGLYAVDYGSGEGWMDDAFSSTVTKTAPTRNVYTGAGAPDVFFSTAVSGRNIHPKQIAVTLVPSTPLISDTFYQYDNWNFSDSTSITANLLGSSSTNFTYTLTAASVTQIPYASFSNLLLRYPHTFNFQGESLPYKLFVLDDTLPASLSKAELEITNLSFNGYHIFYDLTNHKRITGLQGSNSLSIYVPNSGGEKVCFLSDSANVMTPAISWVSVADPNIAPRKFTNMKSSSVALDSAYVIITHRSLWNAAGDYKIYRSGMSGGNHNVIVVDIDDLYEQFAYGIRKHPLAIKNFCRFMLDYWTAQLGRVAPSYVFIIGKGYSSAGMRYNPARFAANLVPSLGTLGSDMLLTGGTGFTGSIYDPMIPVGRIAARDLTDVSWYLDKIQTYELKQNNQSLIEPWMKEVLHFGGGDDASQQTQIRGYLREYEDTVEAFKYGGHVTSYFKTSTDPIQSNQSDSLRKRIKDGVTLMTFFGHAGPTGFDFSTDNPSNFQNYGKYPLVIGNSCFAGNIFTDNSVSEDFIFQNQQGAIGFIASVNLGFQQDLFSYTVELYDAFSDTLYGMSIGKCMQYAIRKIQQPGWEGRKTVCLEMLLHGDPALRMNAWSKPELEIKQPDIYFTPADVTTQLDSFQVNVIVHNLAKGYPLPDSFYVHIRRVFPDNSDTVFSFKQFGCLYSDTVSVNIPLTDARSPGLNRFDVLVDSVPPNNVSELYDEFINNKASSTLFILSPDIFPVYPYKYAIVPYNTVTLKASTADPFAPSRTYRFEIDTTDLFNTPDTTVHKTGFITSPGGVVSWANNLAVLADSMVYFWRVAPDSIDPNTGDYPWHESSFIYIPAKTGWSQAHYFQFKNDKYTNIVYDRPQRDFDYVTETKTLTCVAERLPNLNNYYAINNSTIDGGTCFNFNPKIHVAVFDSLTFFPWGNDTCDHNLGQGNYWSCISGTGNCLPQESHWFQFDLTVPVQVDSLIKLLDPSYNKIPNDNYVLAYTFNTYTYSTLPAGFMQAFQNLGGSNLVSNMQDNAPFIFFAQVGNPSSAVDTIGTTTSAEIQLNVNVQINWTKGNITSEIIGPALNWTSLHWKQHPVESPTITQDSIILQVYGINNAGIETLLIQQVTTSAYDTMLGFISPVTYPFLKLVAVTKDTVMKTPPQLDRWQIYYDEAPEAAVNPNRFYEPPHNPLAEGDSLIWRVAVENISRVPMDSIGIDFFLYDRNRVRHQLKSYLEDSLRVGQYVIANLKYDTTFGLAGLNSLWMEANPYNSWHQTEQYHFNNFAHLNLQVNKDVINPILDVTFDGVHILDGDIVSGKPHILIRLHDENKFLALNDTSSFEFFLQTPSHGSLPVYFVDGPTQNDVMRFTPAVLPKNSCRIEWDPTFTEDGKYELIVQGHDRSLNDAGLFRYKITFEVINRSTITNVMNYPNPFSTSTRFVFTLTGSVVPDDFKIQIMTVTGKVVREIMRDELGNIHVGRNITDYAWNGKDEYGDQLANGLYLYRVLTRINGEKIEKRETEADSFFHNGFGKMYLMR